MLDRLDHIMILQKRFQTQVDQRALDDFNQEYIKDMCIAAHSEVTEILNEINWKPWKKTEKIVYTEKYKEEVIDLFHFVLNLAIAGGMDSNELYDMYLSKINENIKRQEEGY